MQSVKTHTPLPLAALAEAELALLKSKLPVSTDALAAGLKKFKRNKYRNPLDRFTEKILIHGPTGCWIWISNRSKAGYGRFSLNGRKASAHRSALILLKGIDPGELLVCHSCDVRCCVNPEHLFIGTAKDNIDDCAAKGRRKWQSGSKKYNARLHERDVVVVWILRKAFGFRISVIAKMFGVHQSTIGNIFWSDYHWKPLRNQLSGTDGWHLLNHPWPT